MRSIGILLIGVSIALSGCGASQEGYAKADAGSGAGSSSQRAARTERTAAVYAAVVRRLVTKDDTFGTGPSPFKRVFIADGVVRDAASPRLPAYRKIIRPFSADVKDALLRELVELPPVEFVADPRSVVVAEGTCPRVRGDGVLISLGPIVERDGRVRVANSLFFSCLGGQWLTYTLAREDGHWRVTGTTGPVAIS